MNSLAVVLGYFVPIAVVVALFVLLKAPRLSLPVFRSPAAETWVALLLFALVVGIAVGASLLSKPIRGVWAASSAINGRVVLIWSVMLLPFLVTLLIRKQTLETCFIPKEKVVPLLAAAIGMGFLAVVVYLLVIGKLATLAAVATKLFTFPSFFLLAPIAIEEFIFRGFLLARLTAALGRHKGIVVSAVMFGLAHYPRYLVSSQMSFVSATLSIILIVAVAVGGGYGIYAVRCMFYGVFIHWCMDVAPTAVSMN